MAISPSVFIGTSMEGPIVPGPPTPPRVAGSRVTDYGTSQWVELM